MLEFLRKPHVLPDPEKPPMEVVSLADIESPAVHAVVAAWRKWRGLHAMPPRDRINLRDLGRAAAHISLVRVLDDGEDYEFRIVGDAHVQAYGANYQNRRLSDIIHAAPRFGTQLKASYDFVRIARHPFIIRGFIGHGVADAGIPSFETCYLPFGSDSVDHIMNAAVYAPCHAD